MFEPWIIAVIALVGLGAGLLGGMLGVGGSIIMIPVMVMLFGQSERPGFNQHLYQAAAMIVNVAVVAPATVRHVRAGALVPAAFKKILPIAMAFIAVGVLASNLAIFDPDRQWCGANGPTWLGRVLAVFLVYVIVVNILRLFGPQLAAVEPGDRTHGGRITWPRCSIVGSVMGFCAGLMGIGGGAIATPLQQITMKLPLRSCIANSAAIICLTAAFGAVVKNATLPPEVQLSASLTLAGLFAPTAIIGALVGSRLTHVLPRQVVRSIFILVLIAAAWKMAGL